MRRKAAGGNPIRQVLKPDKVFVSSLAPKLSSVLKLMKKQVKKRPGLQDGERVEREKEELKSLMSDNQERAKQILLENAKRLM